MSPTPMRRSPRHRLVGVGDIDLEVVDAHHAPMAFVVCFGAFCLRTKRGFLS